MTFKHFASQTMRGLRIGLTSVALLQFALGPTAANAAPDPRPDGNPKTPIKHVIVIIGENRSFDHVCATYVPVHAKEGEKVWNLLSEGIVKSDGTPGPNFDRAHQLAAFDKPSDPFLLSPPKTEFPSNQLPAPLVGGAKFAQGNFTTSACKSATGSAAATFHTNAVALAQVTENGLPNATDANGLSYY